jgi:acetyl esterase/lipase
MPSYTLCPEARIAEIGAEIASVITQIAETSKGPLVLTGHSAGGHLVARAAAGLLPASVMHRIRRVVPISPVADLEPLMHTSMSEILRIDADEALRESPVALAKPDVPVTVWVGGAERPAFIEQAAKLARVWDCGLEIADGRHHFDVIDALDRNGKLLNFLLA